VIPCYWESISFTQPHRQLAYSATVCWKPQIFKPVANWGGYFKFSAWVMKNIIIIFVIIIETENGNMKYIVFCGDCAASLEMKFFFLPKYIT